MTQLNPATARVVDPVLTNLAQGYKHPQAVGNLLFPRVNVNQMGGKVLEFGKESFLQYNMRRAPGGATKRVSFGYEGKPYVLVQDAVDAPVPREFIRDAAAVPGVDLGMRATKLGMEIVALGLEREQAALAVDAANYDGNHKVTLAGATKWSAATGDPEVDIEAAKEAVRTSTGMLPNVLLLSALAFKACRNNPNVKDRFKYTSAKSITTEMLAGLFDIETVAVGRAITAADDGTFSDVWGNNAVLAYAPQEESTVERPSYGYTYTMMGNPMVEQPYWDNTHKSWVYGVTMERQPVLSGILAGYLIIAPN